MRLSKVILVLFMKSLLLALYLYRLSVILPASAGHKQTTHEEKTMKDTTEKAGWILARIYENDSTKFNKDDLTEYEVCLYLEGWGEDCDDRVIDAVIRMHYGRE